MFEAIKTDVISVFQATFMGGDLTALAVAIGAVLLAVVFMRRGTQIGSMTMLALVLFGAGCIGRSYFLATGAENAVAEYSVMSQLESSWLEFSNLQAGDLVAYFIAFMALILVLFAMKSLVVRE